ncbi:velvet factor [Crucibulum laeve]|uniref:Velvet factor n=1 Tax=Crucibulum laeve TaxID=68775 RepID=A0A5C3MFR6_9AGAR|nr:velvet factor [Crucibulum laeve]
MIQQTNPRQPVGAAAPLRQGSNDVPEVWGQWSGRKHYSLEVVQHPLRARMCGFGDKDRRPLAPAAVAKMIVRREDNTLVDVDDVDCSFFLVTVDLWSGDGKEEVNLVVHPSSTDRYVPPHSSTKTRRRGTSTSAAPPQRPSGNQTPAAPMTPTPSQYRAGDQPTGGVATPLLPPQAPGYNSQGYFPPQPAPISDSLTYPPSAPYGPNPSEPTPTWGYTQAPPVDRNTSFPPPILPSIHSFGRGSASGETWNQGSDPENYRSWNNDSAYPSNDGYSNAQVDPALRHSSSTEGRENSGWSQPESYSSAPEHSMYGAPPYAPQSGQPPHYQPASYQHNQPPTAGGSLQPASRNAFTRTLVGPLSANACRLLDEHRKPGIFFLFQDLSVRTEGTFRLRMRLMNVGAPPAPEAGAMRVHTDVSPVLAQTFTEQFVVYSAKRFPGVPDTTALSIAFGNQGQKLPLRNRHGSKRRRRGESESDDSDGA